TGCLYPAHHDDDNHRPMSVQCRQGTGAATWRGGHVRSLRERLAALQPSSPRPAPPRPTGVPIEAVQTGRLAESERGELFVADDHRDDPALTTLLDRAPLDPSLYLPGCADIDPEEIVFLDTETTGLAGGTGTDAFLVGIGYFEGSRFVL